MLVGFTQLLSAWKGGDQEALKRIVTSVHAELYSIARRMLRNEHNAPTLQATAIVNEAYLRLQGTRERRRPARALFLAV